MTMQIPQQVPTEYLLAAFTLGFVAAGFLIRFLIRHDIQTFTAYCDKTNALHSGYSLEAMSRALSAHDDQIKGLWDRLDEQNEPKPQPEPPAMIQATTDGIQLIEPGFPVWYTDPANPGKQVEAVVTDVSKDGTEVEISVYGGGEDIATSRWKFATAASIATRDEIKPRAVRHPGVIDTTPTQS